MSKETTVFIFGILVFFVPFLGFPREYKEWILIVVGGLLTILGYRLRRLAFLRSLDDGTGGKRGEVFTESSAKDTQETQIIEKDALHV